MGRGVSPTLKPPETCQDRAGRSARSAFATGAPPRRPSKLHNPPTTGTTKKYPSSPRPISTGLLRTLLCFQIRPSKLVVFYGVYSVKEMEDIISSRAFRLYAFRGDGI